MANVAKYKLNGLGNLFSVYARKSWENIDSHNQNIDGSLTHLNYDLHTGETGDSPHSTFTMYERMKKRLSEVKHRDLSKWVNTNVMCDWVITLPKDVSPEQARDFFHHSYDFCCERYGKKNVIGAWVHMDETTPHMHFSFVPVVTDMDGTERLCAKEKVCRFDLQKFHPELQKYVEEKMGQSVAVLNGATESGNISVIKLKTQIAFTELEKLENKIKALKSQQSIIENNNIELNNIIDYLSQKYNLSNETNFNSKQLIVCEIIMLLNKLLDLEHNQ